MVSPDAVGGRSAGYCLANGSANLVQAVARLVVRAVLVVLAVSGYAGYVRVSLRSGRAYAFGCVLLHQALSVAAAGLQRARIQALFVDACFVVRAIGVLRAFG